MLPVPPVGALAFLWRYKSLVGIALLAMALAIQTARLNSARDSLEQEKAARVADRIIAEQKAQEQEATTERNIIVYRDRIVQGGKVAERIEQAPLPGNCETPREIMGADL